MAVLSTRIDFLRLSGENPMFVIHSCSHLAGTATGQAGVQGCFSAVLLSRVPDPSNKDGGTRSPLR